MTLFLFLFVAYDTLVSQCTRGLNNQDCTFVLCYTDSGDECMKVKPLGILRILLVITL